MSTTEAPAKTAPRSSSSDLAYDVREHPDQDIGQIILTAWL